MQPIPSPNFDRDWWLARRGKLSASRISRVVHGSAKGWTTLMDELERELETEEPPDRFPGGVPRTILWGWAQEGYAIANYEFDNLVDIERPKFTAHPTIDGLGCTSDFRVPDLRINGEVKSPYNQQNHTFVVANKQMPLQYFPQVQCQMACHGDELTHFLSYDPRRPDWRSRLVVVPVERDQSYIDIMLEKVVEFLEIFRRGDRPTDPKVRRSITLERYF